VAWKSAANRQPASIGRVNVSSVQAAIGKTGLGEDKPFRPRLTLTSHS
jgi:hypothetical protein